MKKFLLVVFLLIPSLLFAEKKSFENKCKELDSAWEALWEKSDPLDGIGIGNDSMLVIAYRNPRDYKATRKVYLKSFNKKYKAFSKKELPLLYDYVKNSLSEEIASGGGGNELSAANLYVNVLPKDSIETKAAIYSWIILPEYFNQKNLDEVYYISRLLDRYSRKNSKNQYLLDASGYAESQYALLYKSLSASESLAGMWISSEKGKKNLPDFILYIIERNGEYIGIFSQFCGIAKENSIRGSLCSPVLSDSLGNVVLSFIHQQFQHGMTEQSAAAAGNFINSASQEIAKTIAASSNMSWWGTSLATSGISLLAGLAIASISAENYLTNSYLTFKFVNSSNSLSGEYDMIIERRRSSKAKSVKKSLEKGNINLYRVYPHHEIIFADATYPVTFPSRLAYINHEYYDVYPKWKKHYNAYHGTRLAIPLYLYYPIGIPVFIGTASGPYNKMMLKEFRKINGLKK